MFKFKKTDFSLKNFKNLDKRQKKKLVALLVIVFLVFFVIIQNISSIGSSSGSSESVQQISYEIMHLQKELAREQLNYIKIKNRENLFKSKKNDFWYPSKGINMNLAITGKIQDIAKQSKVEMRNLGTIQQDSSSDNISTSEFDFACSGTMEAVTKFVYQVSIMKPKMYWANCSLRPDSMQNTNTIYLSANLKFISIKNKVILNLFDQGTKNTESIKTGTRK
ncbi:MAG TPA: hypothetical protein QF753_01210 [Victivallales bacterium]|nr:hypothetical protein [Victivallales bacterium]